MTKAIDTSKPNPGRVYDYILGGTQNFEVDRQAADAFLKIVPSAPVMARVNRWFLQMIADRWAAEGRTRVLDLASGMPTQGHFNDHMPNGRVLFSDNDMLTVEYGKDLLKDQPNMRYEHADLREPARLLEIAAQHFGDARQLGVGFIGISYFLSDDELRALLQALHAFCAPGSMLAMSYFLPLPEDGPAAEAFKIYKTMVANAYPRRPEQVVELLGPWRIVEEAPLEDWLGVKELLSEEDRRTNKLKGIGLLAAH